MRRLSILGCSFFAAMTLFSCKKNHNDSPPAPVDSVVYVDYSGMKPGNYWVYQLYTIDSLGNGTPENIYDSLYAAADRVINGKTYHTLVSTTWQGINLQDTTFMRDSLSYIVNPAGKILFSSQDFQTVFQNRYIINPDVSPVDSVGQVVQQMSDKNLPVTVPAGTFVTSSMRTTWTMHPAISANGHIRTQNTRYTAGLGMVTQTLDFYVSLPTMQERRLARYHIQQ